MKNALLGLVLAGLGSGVAVAGEEVATTEWDPSEVMTLADWLESEEGQAAVAETIAEEAANNGSWVASTLEATAAEAEFQLSEEHRRQAEDAMTDAIEGCGVQFGRIQPRAGNIEGDISLNYTIALDDLMNGDFANGTTTFEAGNGDFGTSVNVATLLESPGATADCVEMQLGSIYDRLAEEAEKVMDGDFETFERLARVAALKIAVDRAHEIDADFGEALDVLVRLSTMKDPC